MHNIIILAAGPPKGERNRHLELNQYDIIINKNIELCRVDKTRLFVVIDRENMELCAHVAAIPDVDILIPRDRKIYSTFKSALSVEGDCVLVCGDLVGLQQGDVQRFVESEYKSAMCHNTLPYGQHLRYRSPICEGIRRGDCDDSVFLIAQEHKGEYLSDETSRTAESFFYKFYPNATLDYTANNHLGTHMNYTFFHDLWSSPNAPLGEWFAGPDNMKGLISFDHRQYKDND